MLVLILRLTGSDELVLVLRLFVSKELILIIRLIDIEELVVIVLVGLSIRPGRSGCCGSGSFFLRLRGIGLLHSGLRRHLLADLASYLLADDRKEGSHIQYRLNRLLLDGRGLRLYRLSGLLPDRRGLLLTDFFKGKALVLVGLLGSGRARSVSVCRLLRSLFIEAVGLLGSYLTEGEYFSVIRILRGFIYIAGDAVGSIGIVFCPAVGYEFLPGLGAVIAVEIVGMIIGLLEHIHHCLRHLDHKR